ncbi:hypothetical protein CEXT_125041, partial [Caerostris extrusa]
EQPSITQIIFSHYRFEIQLVCPEIFFIDRDRRHKFIDHKALSVGDQARQKQFVSIIWMHALASESPQSQQESFPTHRFIVPILGFDK